MKTIIGFTSIFLIILNPLFSQDTLTLLNGKYIIGNITSTNEAGISITCKGLLGKNQKTLFKDELYSMKKGSFETILYKSNPEEGYSLNNEQMKYYIYGLKEGRKNYHAPMATIGGIATGLTGGVFGFWGMALPSAYVLITGIKTPHITQPARPINTPIIADKSNNPVYGMKYKSQTKIQSDEVCFSSGTYYTYGWETAAKDKKIKNAIRGSIIGFVAFVAGSYLMIR